MQTISYYKSLAAGALSGKWGKSAIATLLVYIIFGAVGCLGGDTSSSRGLFNLVIIMLLPVTYGFATYILDSYRGGEPSYGVLFQGFREGSRGYFRYLGTMLLLYVYEFLWTLLLIVPGIIKSYSYSMTLFVMRDHPQLDYNAAIEESMRLMQGHKMQLFLLDLSMAGWLLLSLLSLGIGFLFLVPYNCTAHAAFYEDLKAQAALSPEGVEV